MMQGFTGSEGKLSSKHLSLKCLLYEDSLNFLMDGHMYYFKTDFYKDVFVAIMFFLQENSVGTSPS